MIDPETLYMQRKSSYIIIFRRLWESEISGCILPLSVAQDISLIQ